ncbi:hypothetical protein [Geobacter sp. SVR]|uniref:hypothetical protein n=1 Tax=Geobacter sp. SVR TaxID=2495594 RepID=UPI00143F0571|nr:hypothetical protein [Geobacter sp. SVR]BCS54680.1 hypothetical protein GSVR_29880 [Geobacter sp. SVR]GCF87620.1 hypothetical protein GSbR_42200 [Geobacter sp. SVR]
MQKELIAVFAVLVVIGILTWLLSGTGILDGFSGMFVRVLLGFSMLFLTVRICGCRRSGVLSQGRRHA